MKRRAALAAALHPEMVRWLILLGGLLAAVTVFLFTRAAEDRRIATEFDFRATWRATNLESKLKDYVQPIVSLGALASIQPPDSQAALQSLAQVTEEFGPPIQRLTWFPRVAGDERAWFELEQSIQQGRPYAIREFDREGQLVRAQERNEYFPSRFEIRTMRVPDTTGFDAASDAMRAAALERARDEGRAVSIQPVLRASTLMGTPTLVIYVPAYRGGTRPASIEARRSLLLGYVSALYFMSDVIGHALQSTPEILGRMTVTLAAKGEAQGPHPSLEMSPQGHRVVQPDVLASSGSAQSRVREFDLLDHRVVLGFAFPDEAIAGLRTWEPWAATLSVLLLTGFLFQHFTTMGANLAAAVTALSDAQRIGKMGHWEHDLARRSSVWSENLIRLTGLPPMARIPVEAVLAHLHAEDRSRYLAVRDRILNLRNHDQIEYEYRWVRPDGELRWFRSFATLRRDAGGRPTTAFGVTIDVTQEKALVHALEQAQSELNAIVDNSVDGLIIIDRAGQVLRFNRAAARLFGYEPEEVIGRNVSMLMPEPHRSAHDGYLDAYGRTGKAKIIGIGREVEGRRKDGSVFPLDLAVGRIVDPDGSMRFVGNIRDLTERKRSTAALRAAEAELRLVTDNAPVNIAYLDSDRRYKFVNIPYARLFNRVPADFIGRHVSDIIGPQRTEIARPHMDKVLAGYKVSYEFSVTDKEGDLHTYHVAYSPELDEAGAVRGFISAGVEVTELRRATQQLRETQQRFDAFMENLPLTAFYKDEDGRMLYANRAYEKAFSFFDGGWRNRTDAERWPEETAASIRLTDLETLRTGEPRMVEELVWHPDGPHQWIIYKFAFRDAKGRRFIGGMGWDVTDQRMLEQQLRQAQKMEVVGQLTGGVAHDFNNLLSVVVGNLELLADEIPPSDPRHGFVQAALDAAFRGGELTHQLLAYSRRQALKPTPTKVEEVIAGFSKLASRLLGEAIELEAVAPADLPPCLVDRTQLETALLNLAINARDAMPKGGRLRVEAKRRRIDAVDAADPEAMPIGDCIEIAVSDTGEGMSEEVRSRALEPFFTTKPVGKGSGLGLSMVYGFVKQSGGDLRIESVSGQGTTIRILLPLARGEAAAESVSGSASLPTPHHSTPTVLVLEDDPDVRSVAASRFRAMGFQVLEAGTAAQALSLLQMDREVHLLFTDIVLKEGESGLAVADEARRLCPGLRVIYTSGYADTAATLPDRLGTGSAFLAKPYRRDDFEAVVARTMQ